MADVASAPVTAAAPAAATEVTDKKKPEKPDEELFNKQLEKAQKEHKEVMDRYVNQLQPINFLRRYGFLRLSMNNLLTCFSLVECDQSKGRTCCPQQEQGNTEPYPEAPRRVDRTGQRNP
jgi:hypothetical protein